MKTTRTFPSNTVMDTHAIENSQNNKYAGAEKNISVGPNLVPVKYANAGVLTYTTDLSTVRIVGTGKSFAVYNPNTTGSITFGADATRTSLAAGACDQANGNVGVPCPQGWSYVSNYDQPAVITSASTILVFLIQDDSTLTISN